MGNYRYVGNTPQTAGNESINFGYDDDGNPVRSTSLGEVFEASDAEVEKLRVNFVIEDEGKGTSSKPAARQEGGDDQ